MTDQLTESDSEANVELPQYTISMEEYAKTRLQHLTNKENYPPALEYHRYPMWLVHKTLDSVIVYSEDQEKEHKSRGYYRRGSPDPDGYLLSKVSGKVDDAIRAMNARMEERITAGLSTLQNKVMELMRPISIRQRKSYEDRHTEQDIVEVFKNTSKDLAESAMAAVREIAKSTRYDG